MSTMSCQLRKLANYDQMKRNQISAGRRRKLAALLRLDDEAKAPKLSIIQRLRRLLNVQ